jgi:UDP-glucose 4-epimerase
MTSGTSRVVLVTGAAGFIGSALCARLLSEGHRVVGYDNLSRGRREYLPDGVELIEGDIRDRDGLERVFAGVRPDCVVHLAAMHYIPDCIARPQETIDVNVEGTRRVLEHCKGSTVRTVVFASTAAVYAPSDEASVEDATRIGPVEIYGESKVTGEQLLEAFHRETGIATVNLRLFNAVGRRETNPHVIPHIFESLRVSDAIALGNVTPRRDYIDSRDVGSAVASVLGLQGLHTMNVGTGVARSVEDVVTSLATLLGRPLSIVADPSRVRAVERMVLLADISRIQRTTGWTPRISWEETLADLIDEYGLRATPHRSARQAPGPQSTRP